MQGRIGSLGELLGARQGDLARLVAERLDSVGQRVGAGLEAQARTTGEQLAQLNERLAVIDAAQARMAGMTEAVVSLREVLANKQSRGAFGQGRMEAIVRDGLPAGAYEFQVRLSNGTRPDCLIRMPGDPRPLAIDAKFPLEAFTAFRDARDDEARRAAGQRARADVGRHVKDIAERYLLPGETQDHRADVRALGIDLRRSRRAFRRHACKRRTAPASSSFRPRCCGWRSRSCRL